MQLPCPIQISGKILKTLETKKLSSSDHHLGELFPSPTQDGSPSLRSSLFNECFHDSNGARKEAIDKFISPVQLNHLINSKKLLVLDICLGLGYNTASIIEKLLGKSIFLDWVGLELDNRPLEIALSNAKFRGYWSEETLWILNKIYNIGSWKKKTSQGKIIWGDARQQIKMISKNKRFDYVFLDAFSPRKCPQLWSEQFLNNISMLMSPGGYLITYCRAAAVRSTLKNAGFELKSLSTDCKKENDWSSGTLAIFPDRNKSQRKINSIWKPLSLMEEEHLLTKASIPYRDPTNKGTTKEILMSRILEQKNSSLESTSSWHRRWFKKRS